MVQRLLKQWFGASYLGPYRYTGQCNLQQLCVSALLSALSLISVLFSLFSHMLLAHSSNSSPYKKILIFTLFLLDLSCTTISNSNYQAEESAVAMQDRWRVGHSYNTGHMRVVNMWFPGYRVPNNCLTTPGRA